MPRALWTGVISFGLVTIPVKLHTAVREHRPRFRLLHATDKSPVRFERVCQREGKPVAWKDLVKGYEYEKGRFVVLTKEDFQAAAIEKHRRIDLLDFVNAAEIDDRYFDTPYYLGPAKGGERAYAVLLEAIRKAGRIGVGRIVLREVQHLAAINVIDDAIVLTTLRYADEIAETASLDLPRSKDVRKEELALAQQLIDTLTSSWDPEKYTDEYQSNLRNVIETKLAGGQVEAPPEAPAATKVVDLMERLRQSLEQTAGRKTTTRKKTAQERPARKRKTRAA